MRELKFNSILTSFMPITENLPFTQSLLSHKWNQVHDFEAMLEKNAFQLDYIAEQKRKERKIHRSLCATQ